MDIEKELKKRGNNASRYFKKILYDASKFKTKNILVAVFYCLVTLLFIHSVAIVEGTMQTCTIYNEWGNLIQATNSAEDVPYLFYERMPKIDKNFNYVSITCVKDFPGIWKNIKLMYQEKENYFGYNADYFKKDNELNFTGIIIQNEK